MFRILAVLAFIMAVVLFAGLLIFDPSAPSTWQKVSDGGLLATAIGLLCMVLEGVPITLKRQ